MNDQKQEAPLNAQQMSALQKQMAEKLTGIVKDVDLRKWSVDQACGLAGTAMEHSKAAVDPVKTAREIHAFLTEGATTK
jgi:hypothetical protein